MPEPAESFDICVNLLNSQFSRDTDAVLARAEAAGVSRLMITATDLDSSARALTLCKADQRYCTAGIHPHDIGTAPTDWLAALRLLAARPEVRAIGETGLDFNRNYSPRDAQIAGFDDHISLAIEFAKPLFVHDRDSQGAVLACLTKHAQRLPPVVIHCFTGSEQELLSYIDAGFYIGITGWITDTRRGESLRQIVKHIPADRLLVETDAPFLRPHNVAPSFLTDHGLTSRPKRRNEPALLPYVIASLADCRGEAPRSLAATTTANARRLFNF